MWKLRSMENAFHDICKVVFPREEDTKSQTDPRESNKSHPKHRESTKTHIEPTE